MAKPKKDVHWFTLEGRFLPRRFRDFHDQKDLFKSIHSWIYKKNTGEDMKLLDLPSWVGGHIYVVDFFLRFMAAHGWTLQRSRQPIEFCDLDQLLREDREASAKAFRAAFDAARKPSLPAEQPE